ncbi:hypothetical protein GCM10023089_04960 [Quisquiliibacterium transsilvanicum]
MDSPWSAPWFAPYRPLLDEVGDDALAGRWPACVEHLNALSQARGLRNGSGRPLRFGAPDAAGAQAYEAHIWATGEVPTRICAEGGWHDLFNALVWLAFPRIKSRLNALQAARIAADGVGARRGALRDAATLFDENGLLLFTDDAALADDLRAFDWQALFADGRQRFIERARVVVFGHALLDKLRAPYKAVCGHAWVMPRPAAGAGAGPGAAGAPDADEAVAAALGADALRSAAFSPVPVLGIPGWWPGNEAAGFYDDAAVFRPGRRYNRGRSGLDGRWRGFPLEEGPDSTGQGAGQRPGAASRKTQGDGKWHREQTAEGES